MPDAKFADEQLKWYLGQEEYKQYSSLINTILQDTVSVEAKYNLWCLLMNHGTEQLTVKNLSKQLREVYCSDKNIEAYVNKSVRYNPKLGYICIDSKHKLDMDGDGSAYISIPCKEEYANIAMERIKEVLTIILIETKTISPE